MMQPIERIFLAADHAGYVLKNWLYQKLSAEFPQIDFDDLGCDSDESVNYPDYAELVAKKITSLKHRGILVCGSGIGMAIAANKFPDIRAVALWDVTSARLSREHNDTNIACFGARLIGQEVALEASRVWIKTEFQSGRHQKRLELIKKWESAK